MITHCSAVGCFLSQLHSLHFPYKAHLPLLSSYAHLPQILHTSNNILELQVILLYWYGFSHSIQILNYYLCQILQSRLQHSLTCMHGQVFGLAVKLSLGTIVCHYQSAWGETWHCFQSSFLLTCTLGDK